MSRISVIRNEKVIPLLPGEPAKGSVFSPWNGLIVEKHKMLPLEIPEHEHAAFCLHMQTSAPGEMEWWSEGKYGRELPGPGSLILLTPGTRDRLRWNRSSERLVVSIDESYLFRAAQELERKGGLSFRNQWMFQDLQLKLLLLEIQREMEADWTTGSLYGDLLGMSLSVALIQKYAGNVSAVPFATGGISKARLKHVIDYIHENDHVDLRLQDLARVANMSLFHFARVFRAAMGVSPHRYLLDQRLQRAKALLRLGTRTVAEVAAETGFSNPGHFARAFRRRMGVSPTDWQRRS